MMLQKNEEIYTNYMGIIYHIDRVYKEEMST